MAPHTISARCRRRRSSISAWRWCRSSPRLLLIDEPSVGLSPLLVSQMITKIGELGERFDLTVMLAEQNFNQAVRIADRGYIIVHGEIVVAANVDELHGNDIVKRLYLGGSV